VFDKSFIYQDKLVPNTDLFILPFRKVMHHQTKSLLRQRFVRKRKFKESSQLYFSNVQVEVKAEVCLPLCFID